MYAVVFVVSHVQLFAMPWTVARQAPPSMRLSMQEYWSRLLSPPPGDLPNPGIKPRSPILQADSLPSEPSGKPAINIQNIIYYNLHIYICSCGLTNSSINGVEKQPLL